MGEWFHALAVATSTVEAPRKAAGHQIYRFMRWQPASLSGGEQKARTNKKSTDGIVTITNLGELNKFIL